MSSARGFESIDHTYEHLLYRGAVRGYEGIAMLALGRTGAVAGAFRFDDRVIEIRYTGVNDVHALLEIDGRKQAATAKPCGNDHTHAVTPLPDPLGAPQAASTGATIIDIMVYYTPSTRSGGGGSAAIRARIALYVGVATQSSCDSSVDHDYRLTYMAETNYNETGTSTDLSRFRNTRDGFMDEVHTDRNLYGGDLMALIIGSSSQFCGVGYLMTNPGTSFRSNAFSVTVNSCLSSNTLAHEMGHNMGSHHDRPNASGPGAYSYSFGYRTPDNAYRQIM